MERAGNNFCLNEVYLTGLWNQNILEFSPHHPGHLWSLLARRATEEGQTSHEDQLNRRRTDVPEIYLNGIWSELATPSSKRSASLSDTNEMKRNVYMDVCFLVGLLCGSSVYYFDLFNFKKDN